jgi:hypothetical protein
MALDAADLGANSLQAALRHSAGGKRDILGRAKRPAARADLRKIRRRNASDNAPTIPSQGLRSPGLFALPGFQQGRGDPDA